MNQWEIYSERTSNDGFGVQQSFVFASPVQSPIDNAEKSDRRGIRTLDSVLPTQGWPKAELSEVDCSDSESVLQLLLPTLANLSAQNRWITLISPPADINQKLFAYYGIDTSRVLHIHPKDDVDDKVTMNKALKNGTSGIVILWASHLNTRFLAQWRKSVKQGNSTGIIINLSAETSNSESVALSFNVSTKKKSLLVNNVKLFGTIQSPQDAIVFSKINLETPPKRRLLKNKNRQRNKLAS